MSIEAFDYLMHYSNMVLIVDLCNLKPYWLLSRSFNFFRKELNVYYKLFRLIFQKLGQSIFLYNYWGETDFMLG